jgi:hypothetical protein
VYAGDVENLPLPSATRNQEVRNLRYYETATTLDVLLGWFSKDEKAVVTSLPISVEVQMDVDQIWCKGPRFWHRVTDTLFTLILRVLQIEEECQPPDSL